MKTAGKKSADPNSSQTFELDIRSFEQAPVIYLLVESLDYSNTLSMDLQAKGIEVNIYFRAEQIISSFDRYRAGCILILLEESRIRSAKELLTGLKKTITEQYLSAPIIVYMNNPNLSSALNYFRYGVNDIIGKFMRDKSELYSIILHWLNISEQNRKRLFERFQTINNFQKLTAPIQDTAKMIYQGLSNLEIAEKSGRKLRTIESRRATVMKELGTKNLTELIRKLTTIFEKEANSQKLFN